MLNAEAQSRKDAEKFKQSSCSPLRLSVTATLRLIE